MDNQIQEQLQELMRVGVGGKYRDDDNYSKKIQEELELEQMMMRGGIDKFNKQINNAKAKGQESTTLHGIVFQQKYVDILSKMIHDWVTKSLQGQAGRHQTAIKLVCQCLEHKHFDNQELKNDVPIIWDKVALIIIKNCIDGISNRQTLNRLSIKIGNALEMEARITYFMAKDKSLYSRVSQKLNSSKSIPQSENKYMYKKNVWVYFMNKNEMDFVKWNKTDKVHLGTKMVYFLKIVGLIDIPLKKIYKNKSIRYVEATDKTIQEIRNFNISNEALHPDFMPMIMPPRKWDNPFVGGYYGKKYNEENTVEGVKNALQHAKAKK